MVRSPVGAVKLRSARSNPTSERTPRRRLGEVGAPVIRLGFLEAVHGAEVAHIAPVRKALGAQVTLAPEVAQAPPVGTRGTSRLHPSASNRRRHSMRAASVGSISTPAAQQQR